MGNKQKGSNAERELIHLFWATQKWTALRVAGSGSMNYPSPDVLASNEGIHLAIECKATISKSQYLEKREVHELVEFAKKAGARPLIAVRFKRTPWYFLNPTDLNPTEHHYAISQTEAERRGMTFEEITAKKS
ncbi:MAG TPA: Holliday junction resolvase Hjc [Candidatus Nanoarchaeia archaeon]|nr:Holliday junction resolvase Hjc [Candidatus Nanoarchaeia archaeon]